MATTPVSQSGVYTNTYTDLPISKEATTSRVLFKNHVLRYAMCTLGTGHVLSEHTSTRAVIINILEGRFRFTINGKDNEVAPGDVIYLAPNDPHAVEALEPSRMSLTLVVV